MAGQFRRFTRYIVTPVICAGAIGGAAIGLAGVAGASTGTATQPAPNPRDHRSGPADRGEAPLDDPAVDPADPSRRDPSSRDQR